MNRRKNTLEPQAVRRQSFLYSSCSQQLSNWRGPTALLPRLRTRLRFPCQAGEAHALGLRVPREALTLTQASESHLPTQLVCPAGRKKNFVHWLSDSLPGAGGQGILRVVPEPRSGPGLSV